MNKDMGVAETCREYLRMLLRAVTVFYILMVAGIMPFYYKRETAYGAIGSNKSSFFQKWGFIAARMLLVILAAYVVFSLFCWYRENRRQKGKLSLLINLFLDDLSLTDKFACFYAVALCMSYYYTAYRDTAAMGTDGWYMGFFPQLLFLLSYFAISRFTKKKERVWGLTAMLGVSLVVFLLGVLNRYEVNPLHMTSSGPGFISTIGNINWYCGYWSVLFPLGAGLFLFMRRKETGRSEKLRYGLAALTLFTGFATGISQGSDSGILAMIALLVLCGCLSVGSRELFCRYLELLRMFCLSAMALGLVQLLFPTRNQYVTAAYRILVQTPYVLIAAIVLLILRFFLGRQKGEKIFRTVRIIWWCLMGLLGAAFVLFVILIVCNTKNPGSIGGLSQYAIFTFDEKWGSSRGATWSIGVQTWLSQDTLHRLVGVGPDCMAAYIYSGQDEALLSATQASFGNHRLTNAHGELLSVLVNMGVFGVIGFGGMLLTAVGRFLRKSRTQVWCAACGLGIFCYMVNNLFSFWQIMNISQMFIVLGLGEGFLRDGREA